MYNFDDLRVGFYMGPPPIRLHPAPQRVWLRSEQMQPAVATQQSRKQQLWHQWQQQRQQQQSTKAHTSLASTTLGFGSVFWGFAQTKLKEGGTAAAAAFRIQATAATSKKQQQQQPNNSSNQQEQQPAAASSSRHATFRPPPSP